MLIKDEADFIFKYVNYLGGFFIDENLPMKL